VIQNFLDNRTKALSDQTKISQNLILFQLKCKLLQILLKMALRNGRGVKTKDEKKKEV